jgi:hypothetical protein
MSQENVAVVSAVIDYYNATGDLLWEMIDSEVEWVVGPAWVAGTYRGHNGVRAFFARIAEAF